MNLLLIAGWLLAAPADRVVAAVGDEVILASELAQAVELSRLQAGPSVPDSVLRAQVLDQLIASQLLFAEAKRETIAVAETEVRDELNTALANLRARVGSEAVLDSMLGEAGLTLGDLKRYYDDEIRRRLLLQQLLAKKGLTTIYIAPTQIEAFYREHKDSLAVEPGRVRLAHIVLPILPSSAEEQAAQKKISEIYTILMQGGDFATVARSFSEDPATRRPGGALGTVKRGSLAEEVEQVLFGLTPGTFSPPFRSRFGYQIVELERKTDSSAVARHILVRVEPSRGDTLRVRAEAERIRARWAAGTSFDSLARQYSADPESRERGGLLGDFLLKGLMPPFDQAVRTLDSGQVSMPILSPFGYHLIAVLAKQPDRVLTFDDVRPMIREYLYQQVLNQRLTDLVAEIEKRTYVQKWR